jgi:hypothetical protein
MKLVKQVYESFCEERFALPTESQVAEIEKRMRFRFPEDYRDFVLTFNGGYFSEPIITPLEKSFLKTA